MLPRYGEMLRFPKKALRIGIFECINLFMKLRFIFDLKRGDTAA